MTAPDELKAILNRITDKTHTKSDLTALRQAIIIDGDQNVVQLGKYNVNVAQGQDIQIGERIYQGPDAEAIRDIIREVLDEYEERKNAEVNRRESDYRTEIVYSTLLPVQEMPRYIYGVPCSYNDLQEREAATKIIRPNDPDEIYPFIIRGGMLWCFQNLNLPSSPFRQLVGNQKSKRYKIDEWCKKSEQEIWFKALLNRALNKLTGRKGLRLDKKHRRYYFQSNLPGKTFSVKYRPLNQRITSRQVVWQPLHQKTRKPKPYWYHLAVALNFFPVSSQHWCLSIRPELRITKDGLTPLELKRIGGRVTHKKSHTHNFDLLTEINFWRYFLSNGEPRIIFPFGKGQRIIVPTSIMQTEIEWTGIPEEYAKSFTNIEYEENLFSYAKLAQLESEDEEETLEADGWEDDDDEDMKEENDQ